MSIVLASATSYKQCNDTASADYYGRIWINFFAPDLESNYMGAMSESERKSLGERLGALFVKKSRSGSLVATISLSQPGLAEETIGVFELAKFERGSGGKNGFTFKMEPQTINTFIGPIFPGNSAAQVKVDLQFLSLKKNKSRITSILAAGLEATNGSGLLKKDLLIPAVVKSAMENVETAIAASFDANAEYGDQLRLSLDPSSSNAVEKSIRFNDTAKKPGRLFVGVARLPTVIKDQPLPGEALTYGDGLYSPEVANGLLNKILRGKTLRDYVAERMPETFADLTTTRDPARFQTASLYMKAIVESSDLALNASDQIAAKWAFLVNSPLMTDADVRRTWILANDEAAGTLKKYRLGLPAVAPSPLNAAETALVDAAETAIESAKNAVSLATTAYSNGSTAALETYQPGILGGDGPKRQLVAQGVWEYCGQPAISSGHFSGVLRNSRWQGTQIAFTGEKYEGNLKLQGTVPVADGFGVKTFAKDSADDGLTSYSGEFRNNAMTGAGLLKWRNGEAFRGTVANGEPVGAGLIEDAEGTLYCVSYGGGDLDVRTAVRIDADGKQIGGSWVAGKFRAR